MSDAPRTRTTLRSPVVPDGAQNDDAANVAAHAAAGAAHAAVNSSRESPASVGALPVVSEYPLFPNVYLKGGSLPAKLAVYKDLNGENAYQGTVADVAATEDKIRGMFGPGTYRLELRDEQNRVLKGGQRHGVRIDPDPRERPREEKSTAIVQVQDQVALERRLYEDRMKLLRQEQEDSLARRRAEAEIDRKNLLAEAEAKERAAEAKLNRELSMMEARAKADAERDRLRYENDRARDREQMQFFATMQSKSTEIVIQALTSSKTDAGMMVGMLKDGLAMGMQNAQGNPEMAQMAVMGKGIDAIAGALSGGGGAEVKQLEAGAKKDMAAAGVEPTKAQRIITKIKTVMAKAIKHGMDPEEAIDTYISQIEQWEAAGAPEGDEEEEAAPKKPAAKKGKADATATPTPASKVAARDAAEPARSETRPVAAGARGDGNGAGAKRAGRSTRPGPARR